METVIDNYPEPEGTKYALDGENKYDKFFGYFINPLHEVADFDPGIDIPCLCCFKPLTDSLRTTISFSMPRTYMSYFYRLHKSCYDGMSDEEISEIEGYILDPLIDKL